MKKVLSTINLLLLFVSLSIAQSGVEKYANMITASSLREHLAILAGDEMEGRETGMEGQRKAAAYIQSRFIAFGLSSPALLKGYQQFYPVTQVDSFTSIKLRVNNKVAIYGKDYVTSNYTATKGSFKTKDFAFAGYGIDAPGYNDYANVDVKGKVVVVFSGQPKKDGKSILDAGSKEGSIESVCATAAKKGATSVLIISPKLESFNNYGKTKEISSITVEKYAKNDGRKKTDYLVISHALAKKLLGNNFDSLLEKAKASQPLQQQTFVRKMPIDFGYRINRSFINASNVIGAVEGTDKKDEYVFITAHYDHLGKHGNQIFYGADDNGSGTAAILQMAAAFVKAKTEGRGPRRTIVFMAMSGEEKGLWGSEYYSNNPVFPLDKTSVDLNIDMVGRIDPERRTADTLNYVYVIGHNKLSSDLPLINEAVNSKYTLLTLDYKYDDPKDPNRIYFRSDHYNFARKSVPILFFYDGMLQGEYHKPGDTIEKIRWPLYENRVRMIFYTGWEMANRESMLKRDIPLIDTTK